jgi:hypothetical protein
MNNEEKKVAVLVAGVADDYTRSSSHPYRLGDCILSKLNLTTRLPRKNPHARDEWLRGYATAIATLVDDGRVFVARSTMEFDGIKIGDLMRVHPSPSKLEALVPVKGRRKS